MEAAAAAAAVSSSTLLTVPAAKAKSRRVITAEYAKSTVKFGAIRNSRRPTARIQAITDVSAAAATDMGQAQISWEIIVGTIAGVTPFVVAGIEFSKRIMAQRRCEECGGSGLILCDKEYVRCPGCGGFLPWQSWKRFFSG